MTTLGPWYGIDTAAPDMSTAGQLVTASGGSTTTTTPGSQTFNFGGYMLLHFLGGSVADVGGPPTPDGHGWLFDSTSLVGESLPAGNWTLHCTLQTSDAGAPTGNLTARLYVLNILGAVYTPVGSATITGLTLSEAGATYTFTLAGVSVAVASGDYLYLDFYWQQTGGGTGSTLTGYVVSNTSSGKAGTLDVTAPTVAPVESSGQQYWPHHRFGTQL